MNIYTYCISLILYFIFGYYAGKNDKKSKDTNVE